MAEWKVYLENTQGSSRKFWRAKVEGSQLIVNWGRIGTAGQSKTAEIDGEAAALAELEKQAAGKRKKGYIDASAGEPEKAAPASPPPKQESWEAQLKLSEEGRTIELSLACDGKLIRTSVTETYDSEDSAAAAFTRIKQRLIDDGYSKK